MNEYERTVAFSRAYALFADIFRQGVNTDHATLFNITTHKSQSEYGAEHYQLFGRNVFPYESIFLGTEGLLGGAITESVTAFYREVGFAATSDENADHIGVEFSLMAFLCGAESDAIADKLPHHVQRMRHLQRRFLDEHLLLWLSACVKSVQQQGQGIYTNIAAQSLSLALEHRKQLGDNLMQQTTAFALADVPDLLTNEKTSLRDIAHYLLTPAYTGFFLSSDDIKRLGAKFRLPHGFGSRQQILVNLLRTASDYDLFETVFEELSVSATSWLQFYKEQTILPQTIKVVWIARLSHSITMLSDMRRIAIQANMEG